MQEAQSAATTRAAGAAPFRSIGGSPNRLPIVTVGSQILYQLARVIRLDSVCTGLNGRPPTSRIISRPHAVHVDQIAGLLDHGNDGRFEIEGGEGKDLRVKSIDELPRKLRTHGFRHDLDRGVQSDHVLGKGRAIIWVDHI